MAYAKTSRSSNSPNQRMMNTNLEYYRSNFKEGGFTNSPMDKERPDLSKQAQDYLDNQAGKKTSKGN